MAKLKKIVEIKVAPEQVFALLIDPKKFSEVGKGFVEVEQTSKGPPGVGSTHHFVGGAGGQTVEWDGETTEFVENKKWSFRTVGAGKFKSDGSWTLEPTATGTKVTFSMNYTLPYSILGKVIDKLRVSKDLEKKMGIFLANIKKALEK